MRGGIPGLHVEDGGGGGFPPSPLEIHQIFSAGIDHPEVVIDKGTIGPMALPSTRASENCMDIVSQIIQIFKNYLKVSQTQSLDWLLIQLLQTQTINERDWNQMYRLGRPLLKLRIILM